MLLIPSDQDVIQIIEQASTITERLCNSFHSDLVETNHYQLNKRIQEWCQVVAQGNQEKFSKRLRWDGLDINSIHPILDVGHFKENEEEPTWAETLRLIIQAAAMDGKKREEIPKRHRCFDSKEPIPFEDIYLPFIQVAQQKLIDRVRKLESQGVQLVQLLSEAAQVSLEHTLLLQLSSVCFQTLDLEFSIFRSFKQSSLNCLLQQHSKSDNLLYKAFVKNLFKDGLKSFFKEYSVLARLVAIIIDFWIDATTEFLQRLALDLSEINQLFLLKNNTNRSEKSKIIISDLGQVIAIKSALSDAHNQGRYVIALTFACGLKLVYKPKDLGLEVAFSQFLDWCNRHGSPLTFKSLKVLNRGTYGWVEFVEQLPCENEDAVQRFYQRAGMLLSILYVLGATDCHQENLIANGEHLVLIDMETLFHNRFQEIPLCKEEVMSSSIVNQLISDSVLRCGLLPQWEYATKNGIAYDTSGLGGIGEQKLSLPSLKWQDVNTDNMGLVNSESVILPSYPNTPILNGVTLSPNDYVDKIVVGFEKMYCFLLQHREALLAADGPISIFAHQTGRFVFRDTKNYVSILKKSLDPKYLRNGADWSIVLDYLSQAFLVHEDKPAFWSILAVERQALEQLDIPFFTAKLNSDVMNVAPNKTIEKCFQQPSYNLVTLRFQLLNKDDLVQQTAIIRGSFYSRFAHITSLTNCNEQIDQTFKSELVQIIEPLTHKKLLQQALFIAQELQQRAISVADGSATWIDLAYVPGIKKFQFQPLSYHLGNGSAGVALFLAALEKIAPNSGFRGLALSALQPIRQLLHNKQSLSQISQTIGMGGAVGLGSLIYALVRCSQFLGETTLMEDAKQLATLITPDLIAADRNLDITAGAAGTIMGLLTLYNATAEQSVLTTAINCGEHLLKYRSQSESGLRAWATLSGKLITGFSHGAAGIAVALTKLSQVTKNPIFLAAAIEAIDYERSVFSPIVGNWPDLRLDRVINGKPSFAVSWCHGAPGIALSRLGCLESINTDEIRQEINIALQTTQQYSWQGIDNLCCGNFGRIDVLLAASNKLGQKDLLPTINKQVTWLINRAEKNGCFSIYPQLPKDALIPGFFQGISGIGYELLRLAYPNLLPSALLWE